MQPEFISFTWMPASFKNPPSMPISPNSFSISTIFSPWKVSSRSFLIKVVFPAPKKPEIIVISVIVFFLLSTGCGNCLFPQMVSVSTRSHALLIIARFFYLSNGSQKSAVPAERSAGTADLFMFCLWTPRDLPFRSQSLPPLLSLSSPIPADLRTRP